MAIISTHDYILPNHPNNVVQRLVLSLETKLHYIYDTLIWMVYNYLQLCMDLSCEMLLLGFNHMHPIFTCFFCHLYFLVWTILEHLKSFFLSPLTFKGGKTQWPLRVKKSLRKFDNKNLSSPNLVCKHRTRKHCLGNSIEQAFAYMHWVVLVFVVEYNLFDIGKLIS